MSQRNISAWSYIVGFIFSVQLTLLAYEMVVHHSFIGARLLVAIVSLAVVQMILQIFFFLHLGRGPKPLYNIAFFVSTVGIILVVIGGSLFIMNNLHYNMPADSVTKILAEGEGIAQIEGNKTGACPAIKSNHQILISNSAIQPGHTNAKLCDTITFIAKDGNDHLIAFGPHDRHSNYAGNNELSVSTGKNFTMTLNQTGTFQFHDHLHEELVGDFTVR